MLVHPHGRYLATAHFGSLDGLRCLSIAPVIWHHATPFPLPGFWGRGPAGVDLFFCISGFLITTLLLREKARNGRIDIKGFYWRRAVRILPLFYLTLSGYTAFALLLPAGDPSRAHFLDTLPLYATFTANWLASFAVPFPVLFAFAWSLCVEQQFYACWPWLVAPLRRRWALLFLVAWVAFDWFLEGGGLPLATGSTAYRIATSLATPIGLGAILALLLESKTGFAALWPVLGRRFCAPAALLAILGFLASPSPLGVGYQLSLAALVGSCVIQEQHALRSVLTVRPVVYIGAISYGLYLLHPAAIGVVRALVPQYGQQALVIFVLSLPLAVLFAALSHRYVERPLAQYRARHRDSIAPKGPQAEIELIPS